VLAAAVVGALLVLLGALAWQPIIAMMTGEDDLTELETRAWAAHAQGRYESPPGDNVYDLTQQILDEDPRHAAALELRARVAERLRQEGELELEQGHPEAAEQRFVRALRFAPDDADALLALSALRAPPPEEPEPTPELRAVPDSPRVGEPVTLFVELLSELDEDVEVSFEVTRGGQPVRRLDARADGDRRHFVATYAFRRTGAHEVEFLAGDLRLAQALEVAPRGRVANREEPASVVQHNPPFQPQVTPATVNDDGIDWGLPGERPSPTMNDTRMAPAPSPAPAPPPSMAPAVGEAWTSGGSI
jgi:hypothetical protein